MNNVSIAKVQITDSTHPQLLRSLGLAIKHQVDRHGGACLPLLVDATLTIYAYGMNDVELKRLLDAFAESMAKKNATLSIVQKQGGAHVSRAIDPNYCGPGAILRQKLTRGFF